MLNWNKVLTYIKANISLPSSFIEDTDEQIKDYIILTALQTFSEYNPDTGFCMVYPDNPLYKVPASSNKFYFFDEEGLSIYNIKEAFFQLQNEVTTGHPLVGANSFSSLMQFATDTFKSRFLMRYTMFDKTYHFHNPNIIEIRSSETNYRDNFVVSYEREQPHDLSKVPPAIERKFMDLCLADYMIKIGNLRSQYQNIQTPFGEIPISGDDIRQRGEDLKQRTEDVLAENAIPQLIADVN